MYALDNKSGIEQMPEIPEVFSKNPLWFTEGRDGNSPSYPGAHWFNIVQAELLNMLKEAGIEPDKADVTQLAQAFRVMAGQVDSIATLREFEPVRDRQMVYVKGYYANSTKGGGYFVADLADSRTADNGGTVIVTAGGKRWKRIIHEHVSLYDFGAIGDYETDDTAAFKRALHSAQQSQCSVFIPDGVFSLSESIEIPEGVGLLGVGATQIAPFPQRSAEKDKLRDGYKHRLSGSVLMFRSPKSPQATQRLLRQDKYQQFTPCLYTHSLQGVQYKHFSIIQDIDVLDANGRLTTKLNDNRASAYDVGFLSKGTFAFFDNITIFGLFEKNGLIITATDEQGNRLDNEYSAIRDCLISSGLAIIAGDEQHKTSGSLTGVSCLQSGFYGADHHYRPDGFYHVPTLFIDGDLCATNGKDSADIRGASFTGCHFRSYANDAIVLGHCNDVSFIGCTAEFPVLKGIQNADIDGGLVGFSYTGNVRAFGLASTGSLRLFDFMHTIGGKFQIIGAGGFDVAYFGQAGKIVSLYGDSHTGDSVIQLTKDASSTNLGWSIRRDESENDALSFRYNGATLLTLNEAGVLGVKQGAFEKLYPSFNSSVSRLAYPLAQHEKTGFYRAGENSIGVAINGVAQYVWTAGGNLLPSTANENSLGSNSNFWRSIHVATPSKTSNDYTVPNTKWINENIRQQNNLAWLGETNEVIQVAAGHAITAFILIKSGHSQTRTVAIPLQNINDLTFDAFKAVIENGLLTITPLNDHIIKRVVLQGK